MILLLATTDNRILDVIIVLAAVAALIVLALAVLLAFGYLLGRRHPATTSEPTSAQAATPTQPVTAIEDSTHDPELVAVLTAAAVATLGQPVRVTDIQPAHSTPAGPLTPPAQATP